MDKFSDIMEFVAYAQKARADAMPTEELAISAMFEAYQRLKEMGWNDIMYCPKDGTVFDAIGVGSTGVCPHHYTGDWPNGHFWAHEAGDLWPASPVLFRLTSQATEN